MATEHVIPKSSPQERIKSVTSWTSASKCFSLSLGKQADCGDRVSIWANA